MTEEEYNNLQYEIEQVRKLDMFSAILYTGLYLYIIYIQVSTWWGSIRVFIPPSLPNPFCLKVKTFSNLFIFQIINMLFLHPIFGFKYQKESKI